MDNISDANDAYNGLIDYLKASHSSVPESVFRELILARLEASGKNENLNNLTLETAEELKIFIGHLSEKNIREWFEGIITNKKEKGRVQKIMEKIHFMG